MYICEFALHPFHFKLFSVTNQLFFLLDELALITKDRKKGGKVNKTNLHTGFFIL